MRIRVISNHVALGKHPLDQAGTVLNMSAHYEECGGHLLGFQDVQNCRCVPGIRAVIEGKGNSFWPSVSIVIDNVACGICFVFVYVRSILNPNVSITVSRGRRNANNFSFAILIDRIIRGKGGQLI